MSRVPRMGGNRDLSDSFVDFLSGAARLLMWAGLVLSLIGVGFLIYTASAFANGAPASEAQALTNISVFEKILWAGVLALGTGTTYLFWGESVLGALQLLFAAFMYLAPIILPMMGIQGSSQVSAKALTTLQSGGMIFGIIALGVILVDVAVRMKERAQQGSKADQLKYGKGVKEERDRQNVFMGKCWQLPFCRKFVRERCPIYHARTSCWKERVGCMCEEEVIRNAMENKPIPKDQLMAANYIPRNNKLTEDQKKDRCRSCVIYNEHQKHKYRAALPTIFIGFGLLYGLGRQPLLAMTGGIVSGLDAMVKNATLQHDTHGTVAGGSPFQEFLLICMLIIAIAYSLKLLEYLIFKAKV